MRNLAIECTSCIQIPSTSKALISSVVHDLLNGDRYVAVETLAEDDVQVDIWKLGNDAVDVDVPIAFLSAQASPVARRQVLSCAILAESQSLCLVLAGGTIATLSLDSGLSNEVEIVGDVEVGIKAAEWSPEGELLVLITGSDGLLQMTSSFDVLNETTVHTTETGEAQYVNVGWGSKSTQFHGTAGKTAAQSAAAQAEAAARGRQSPDDDEIPRISWRGDGAYFVVSSLSQPSLDPTEARRRLLRVYSRTAVLQNTSEPVPGLEHSLAWRPSGSLIASTQRFGFSGGGAGREDRHDVVFFERNGLRHGEFQLREDGEMVKDGEEKRWKYRVKELLWSSDSAVLAVWIEREAKDVVQLWTMNNYHWYHKHTVLPPLGETRFTSVRWHPETALSLNLTTSSRVLERVFAWTTTRSSEPPPLDSGTVAVIDGSSLLLTPFRKQNVPPPMSSYQIKLEPPTDTPVDIAFDSQQDVLAILRPSSVEIWALNTRLLGGGSVADPQVITRIAFDTLDARQVDVSVVAGRVTILGYDWPEEKDVLLALDIHQATIVARVLLDSRGAGRLVPSAKDAPPPVEKSSGEIARVDLQKALLVPPEIVLPAFCFQVVQVHGPSLVIGLSSKGTLYAGSPTGIITLATNCTSFVVDTDFLIYTTSSHEARFVPISRLIDMSTEFNPSVPEWEKRRVERGSRIVTVVPSSMSLVLQMPRGNLETVNPRPLVLQKVRKDIDGGNYRDAFLACRKHRIDLNMLVDHDPERFMSSIADFLSQIDDVDHINLLLSGIGQSSQSPARIAEICDAIREQLEQRGLKRYVSSILTAHVVKTPPDIEGGLGLLLRLRDENPDIVEDAIKYIVFLVDVDKLFDIALGMYDFSLVLMVAQHSQKDPREYLPFLRELSVLEPHYQRYRIDDHLKRFAKAVGHLRQAETEHSELAKRYIKQHELYREALDLWKDDKARYEEILDMYGDYLFDKREYASAALAFVMSHKTDKALQAYEKDLGWRELFALATTAGASADRLSEIGVRVADKLVSRRRYPEAAQVLLDYSHDVEEAVSTLLMGNEYSEAIRVAHLHGRVELIEEHVHPSALDAAVNVVEDIEEMTEQLEKQVARWDELQERKTAEPDAYYLQDNPALHNVDVMTEASTVATAFTRFTVAPSMSVMTGVSTSKSSKGRRKNERKRLSGKKGTVNEEEYLVSSVVKLVARLHGVQGDVAKLLPHLLLFSDEHRAEAVNVQNRLARFEEDIGDVVERLWAPPVLEPPAVAPNNEAGEYKKPEKPVVRDVKWRLDLVM